MTSLLFWRTQSFRSAPSRKCCHGNSKGSTLKRLPFNKFLYIFRKSHQIWLNYLSSSSSYAQKTSRVVPNTPPGRIGLNSPLRSGHTPEEDFLKHLQALSKSRLSSLPTRIFITSDRAFFIWHSIGEEYLCT